MQNKSFYFLLLFFSFCFVDNLTAAEGQKLHKADSLFELKKYTESFEIYDQLLNEEQKASSKMLLKMAFIKEGLGDYSSALYYLNVYYLKTSDKQARTKMKDIAEEHNLSGFVINDSDFFLNLLNKYKLVLAYSIFGLSIIFLLVILYQKIGIKTRPVAFSILFTMLQVVLFYVMNYADNTNQAIIVESNSYLMSGPSSGSGFIEIVEKGHRVKTFEEHGLWLEILWNDQKVYIKMNKVKKLINPTGFIYDKFRCLQDQIPLLGGCRGGFYKKNNFSRITNNTHRVNS
ncbi:MAG: tetratricopeptide (TPR) repeat protein [Cyclobacteriaceae bacterium]|jgi:tetratricopeptide (TPR) repeat protein